MYVVYHDLLQTMKNNHASCPGFFAIRPNLEINLRFFILIFLAKETQKYSCWVLLQADFLWLLRIIYVSKYNYFSNNHKKS